MGEVLPLLTPEILVPRIGAYLVEKGWITSQDLQDALQIQQSWTQQNSFPPLLGQILVNMGKLSRAQLDLAITEQILALRQALQNANALLEERVRQRTLQLEEALNRLAEAGQAKTNFIANISHELRTPLTHIRGYLDLLASDSLGQLSAEAQEATEIMLRSAGRLEQLIEDLILFADSQREKMLLNCGVFSIHALGRRQADRLAHRAIEKQVRLVYQPEGSLPPAWGDEEKIGWVISHLLENAIKFTPGGGTVKLQLLRAEGQVRVAVADTGIGIPPERLVEIFEPFHQLDGSSTRKYGGAGLGLSLARQIIEAHGSVLNVISKTGKGSCFDFYVQAAPGSEDAAGNGLDKEEGT